MDFQEKRGIGHCGLACVLCSYEDCPGCAVKMANGEDCSAGKCAVGKNIDGCHACTDYDSCKENMPHGKRSHAFLRYAKDYGKQALMDRLYINFKNGITYHNPDKTPGDYDKPETEEGIYQLLRYGRNDPYAKCPEFETERLKIRQVCEGDAEELVLAFYGDLSGWMFYGNDMCKSIFAGRYATLDEMKKCIRYWLDEYRNRYYIRFSVVDKSEKKAVGTIEVFDNAHLDQKQGLKSVGHGAILHIDLAASYETQDYISELLNLADGELFRIFGFKYLCIQAIPDAKGRVAALRAAGYEPFAWEQGREHYYLKQSPVYGE